MSSDEPNVLSIGTEVSAKYKGAFCEAKIKKVTRLLRLKVTTKPGNSTVTVSEQDVEYGQLKVGGYIVVKLPNNTTSSALITKIFDQSHYTVVFDDGDEATLKRTSLCLKSGKHFSESESLDQLPLTHPEHFVNPVRRCRRMRQSTPNTPRKQSRVKQEDDSDDETKNDKKLSNKSHSDVGKVVRVEYGDKRGFKIKDVWFPAYVVAVDSKSSKENIQYKVRSFRDDRYYNVYKKDAGEFNKDVFQKKSKSSFSTELQTAIEKALNYLDNKTFPSNWDDMTIGKIEDHDDSDNNEEDDSKEELDEEIEDEVEEIDDDDVVEEEEEDVIDEEEEEVEDDDDGDDDNDVYDDDDNNVDDDDEEEETNNSDEANSDDFSESESDLDIDDDDEEEQDMFVANLYKFMDQRGTPINAQDLYINGQDLNLYKLYQIVHKMGGPNRVNTKNLWKNVFNKLGLSADSKPNDNNSDNNPIMQLKGIYKDYLHPFHDLNRKLGLPPVLGDSRFTRTSRPSRGERKREKERSRLNSVSSTTSTNTNATSRRSSLKTTPKKNNKNHENVEQEQDQSSITSDNNNSLDKKPTPKVIKTTATVDKISGRKKKNHPEEGFDQVKYFPNEQDWMILDNPDKGETNTKKAMKESIYQNKCFEYHKTVGIGGMYQEASSNECIPVLYGKGKQTKTYEAKVLATNFHGDTRPLYFVHYYGWGNRYDEWIDNTRITFGKKVPQKRSWNKRNKGELLPKDPLKRSSDSDDSVRTRKIIKQEPKDADKNLKVQRTSESKSEPIAKVVAKSQQLTSNEPQLSTNEKKNRVIKEENKESIVCVSTKNNKNEESFRRRTSFSQKDSAKNQDSNNSKISSSNEEKKENKKTKVPESKTKTKQQGTINKNSESDDDTKPLIVKKDKEKNDKIFDKDKEKSTDKGMSLKKSLEPDDEGDNNENVTGNKKRKVVEQTDSSSTQSNEFRISKSSNSKVFESSSSQQLTDQSSLSTAINNDEYEFVDDEAVVETDSKCPMKNKTTSQSTSTIIKSFTISDLAKKESTNDEQIVEKGSTEKTESNINKPDKSNNGECSTLKVTMMTGNNTDTKNESTTLEVDHQPCASTVMNIESIPTNQTIKKDSIESLASICEDLTQQATCSTYSLSEDLEVEDILSKDNDKSNEMCSNLNEKRDKQEHVSEFDSDDDKDSIGELVVAEDDEEEETETNKEKDSLNEKMDSFSNLNVAETTAQIAKQESKLEELAQKDKTADVSKELTNDKIGEMEKPKEESEKLQVLFCKETLPASPPPFFSVNLADVSNSRDSSQESNEKAYESTFMQMQQDSSSSFSNTTNEASKNVTNQPFSQLIAAASHQSSSYELNPAISTNIVNDEELDDDDDEDEMDDELDITAGNEADVDEFDDYNEEETDRSTARRTRSFERKRRNRSQAKAQSSMSAHLSSQESSQDGDDQSVDEDSVKNSTENTAPMERSAQMKGKSGSKRLGMTAANDLKNDDEEDSSSCSPNRGDKENKISLMQSPKKRRRGRIRTVSQSETSREVNTQSTATKPYKTRGRHRSNNSLNQYQTNSNNNNFNVDPFLMRTGNNNNSTIDFSTNNSTTTTATTGNFSNFYPKPPPVDYGILNSYKPVSKYDYLGPIDLSLSSEGRCEILLNRMKEIKKKYNEYLRKWAAYERKKKRMPKKTKDNDKKREPIKSSSNNGSNNNQNNNNNNANAGQTNVANNSEGSEESSSSSKNEIRARTKRDSISKHQPPPPPSSSSSSSNSTTTTTTANTAQKENNNKTPTNDNSNENKE